MVRRKLLFLGSLLCAAGCSERPPESAIGITVQFTQSSRATCVRVVAQGSGGEQLTEPMSRDGAPELKIAVLPGTELTGEVSFKARGFVGKGCQEPLLFNEESAALTASFAPGVQKLTLMLSGADPSVDVDRDGYRTASAGGPDCDDLDPARNPAAAEACGNALDDDCSGAADCADPACLGNTCTDGDRCTSGETCTSGGVCGAGDPVVCNQPPKECDLPVGQCQPATGSCQYGVDTGGVCSLGLCRGDGVCVPSTTEVFCSNGTDDDADSLIDCADPDCASQTCSDGDACTVGDLCKAGQCAPGTAATCMSPPGACYSKPGTCQPTDGGCSYDLSPEGSTCPAGECRADGGCGVSELGSLCANGLDDDEDTLVDCEDPSCAAQSCSDSNACSTGEVCSGSGKCQGGTAVLCASPPSGCFDPTGSCSPDGGGCQYTVRAGACDGGYCLSDGGCTLSAFPYAPSNFDPAAIFAPTGGLQIDCAGAIFDSTPGVASPFTNWCAGQSEPVVQTVSQPGGPQAALLAVQWLQVGDAGTLRVVGSRPVIFAVSGEATIRGQLSASGLRFASGAGAEVGCVGASNGQTNGGTTGGGGGGGYATAGARGGATAQGATGGAAGGTSGNASLVPLRGGCQGGRGGTTGDLGGGGGGGLQLTVAGTLSVSGQVASGGGGGAGGNFWNSTNGGGAGGGSGGGLLLEGAKVVLSGSSALTANGGGAGEGDGSNADVQYAGEDGQQGSSSSMVPAPGGNGADTNRGGPGGYGGAGVTAPTVGQNGLLTGNGGGGGGAVGRIRINSAGTCNLTGIISPPATSNRAGAAGCP